MRIHIVGRVKQLFLYATHVASICISYIVLLDDFQHAFLIHRGCGTAHAQMHCRPETNCVESMSIYLLDGKLQKGGKGALFCSRITVYDSKGQKVH